MGKRTESLVVLCPFYKSESGNKIICEGLGPHSSLHMCFGDAAARKRYEMRFCKSWEYEGCKLAELHEKRYEDPEE